MAAPEDRGPPWIDAQAKAFWALKRYFDRKWFRVAHELCTRIYSATRKIDYMRVWVTDCEHDKDAASESTEFSIKYYAKTREEVIFALSLMRKEAMVLQSLGWLKIESETDVEEHPTIIIRALKYAGGKASAQKRHTKKAEAVQEKEKQTAGTEVVSTTNQQEKERPLKELEANVATLKKQYLETYYQARDKITEEIRRTGLQEEFIKQIHGISEQTIQTVNAVLNEAERAVSRKVFVEDILSAVKNVGHSKSRKPRKGQEEDSHRQELMTEIADGLYDLLRREGKITWNTLVAKMFDIVP